MVSKPTVKLPSDLIECSKVYGRNVVATYANGGNAASRAVSSHGAERNIELQAHARMAECAFCLCIGVDPLQSLDWSRQCDPGWDVYAFGVRWDVKATLTGRHLIWPVNKRHIFASKACDEFVLVRGLAPHFLLAGFIPKPVFGHEHQVAGEDHILDAGTWYMHEDELWPLREAT